MKCVPHLRVGWKSPTRKLHRDTVPLTKEAPEFSGGLRFLCSIRLMSSVTGRENPVDGGSKVTGEGDVLYQFVYEDGSASCLQGASFGATETVGDHYPVTGPRGLTLLWLASKFL